MCFDAQSTMMVISGLWVCAMVETERQTGRLVETFLYADVFLVLRSASSTHRNNRGKTTRRNLVVVVFYAQQLSFFLRPVNHDGYIRAMVVRRQRWRQNGRLGRVHDGAW